MVEKGSGPRSVPSLLDRAAQFQAPKRRANEVHVVTVTRALSFLLYGPLYI